MAQMPRSIKGSFVAEVKGYNVLTRELEVFIPKLMPGIPEGQKDIPIRTNMGNPSILTKYNAQIMTSSTIIAKAIDTDEPLPTIGSKVMVKFLDNSPQYCCWSKFNMNFDYDVIEEEKYARQFYLKIGDKEIPVHRDDKIIIELEENTDVVLLDNENKEKTFRIIKTNSLINDIEKLKEIVGSYGEFISVSNERGEKIPQEISGSGLAARYQNLLSRVEELETKLSELIKE